MYLGICYNSDQRYAESCVALKSALEIDLAGLGPEHRNLEWEYWWLGSSEHGAGNLLDAIKSIDAAIKIAEKEPPCEDLARLQLCRGRFLVDLKRYAEAEIAFSKAQSMFGQRQNDIQYYEVRVCLANAFLQDGKPDLADAAAQEAIPAAGRISRREDESSAYCEVGNYFALRGRYQEAEKLYRQALTASQGAFSIDHVNHIQVLTPLARCLFEEKKLKQSAAAYKRAIELCDKNSVPPGYTLLCRSAEVFRATNQIALAKATEARARTLTLDFKDD
jgi:tetratricopeptide (TPR) repeat protein